MDRSIHPSIDFNSVSGKSDPVVCRLMDFKRDEYRKLKLSKQRARASAKRVQKKKEIRLRVSRHAETETKTR